MRRSELESFDCPHRYRALVVNGFQDPGPEARRGQCFHEAAARYITALAAAGLDHDHALAVAALTAGFQSVPVTEPQMREVEGLFWRWAEGFRLNLDAFLLAEERQGDDFTWTPDLVYAHPDALELRDWKTYFAPLTAAQAREEFQSRFYLWRARKVWPGFAAYRMTYVYVRVGVEVTVEIPGDELDKFGEHVAERVAAISRAHSTGYWPATPGAHCVFCRLACPVVDQPEAMTRRCTTADDAVTAAGRLLVLERELKALRPAVAGWATDYGPIRVGGMTFEVTTQTRLSWELGEALRILAAHGIETPKITLSKSALTSYVTTKKHAGVGRDLVAAATVTPSAKARWAKRPEEPQDGPADDPDEFP